MQLFFEGGPEPFETEISQILGSNREDKSSKPFFELQPIAIRVTFNRNLQSQSPWSLFNETW